MKGDWLLAQINKDKNNQIRTLIRLGDTLLPKLMSGEVRVEMEELIYEN